MLCAIETLQNQWINVLHDSSVPFGFYLTQCGNMLVCVV
jgi:hypothetical protein